MSYKPLSNAEHHDGDIAEPSLRPHAVEHDAYRPPKRRFFKSSKTLHYAISVAAGTVMMLFGYEQGVFGGIIVGDDFLEYFHNPSPAMQGFVTSVYDLGCFVGAVVALFVGEKLGRKRMLILFTVIMGSGILVQTACHNMTVMVWGRLIAGIGNGGNTATAPVWHVSTSAILLEWRYVLKSAVPGGDFTSVSQRQGGCARDDGQHFGLCNLQLRYFSI